MSLEWDISLEIDKYSSGMENKARNCQRFQQNGNKARN